MQYFLFIFYVQKNHIAKPLKKILKKNLSLSVNGRLWLECGGKKYYGPELMELLGTIAETGSINKAAKQMPMAYKRAWEIINQLNASSAKPLVETHIGGENGGGLVITPEARQLMAYYKSLVQEFLGFLAKETNEIA